MSHRRNSDITIVRISPKEIIKFILSILSKFLTVHVGIEYFQQTYPLFEQRLNLA